MSFRKLRGSNRSLEKRLKGKAINCIIVVSTSTDYLWIYFERI